MVTLRNFLKTDRVLIFILLTIGILGSLTGTLLYCFLEPSYLYLGIAIGVPLFFIVLTLILVLTSKRRKIEKKVISNMMAISRQVDRLKTDEYENIMEKSDVKEIKALEDSLATTIDTLSHRRYTVEYDEETPIEMIESETGLYNLESINRYVLNRTSKRYIFNGYVLACRIEGCSDYESRMVLVTKIKHYFEDSVLGLYNENTIVAYIESRGNLKLVQSQAGLLVSSFNIADFKGSTATNSTCRIGISNYPFSQGNKLISDAVATIRPDKNVAIFPYEEKIDFIPNQTNINDSYRRTIFTLYRLASIHCNETSSQRIRDKIASIIKEFAELFHFNNAGYILKVPGHNTFKTVSEYNLRPENSTFSNLGEIEYDYLKDYLDLFNEHELLFGSEIDGIPLGAKSIFDNLGISSYYHFKIFTGDNLVGIFYFNDSEPGRVFSTVDYEILFNLKTILSSLIQELISWHGKERNRLIIESILKHEEKYIFAYNRETNELTYISNNLTKYFPELKIGTKITFEASEEGKLNLNIPIIPTGEKVKWDRISSSLIIKPLLSISGAVYEQYMLVEVPSKLIRTNSGQLDKDFQIPVFKVLAEDVMTELKESNPGYIALICPVDYRDKAKRLEGSDSETRILSEVLSHIVDAGFGDWVYRYNEDTFAILFHRYPRTEALHSLEKLYDNFDTNFVIDGRECRPDFSCSLISYPGDVVSARDLKETLAKADTHMRELGHNILYIFGEKGGRKLDRSLYILDVLDDAILKNKLQVFLQPVIDAKTKKPVAAEALLRLIDPSRGFIPPLEFVPIANKHGRMFEIEQSIIVQLCELWKKYGFGIFKQVGVSRMSVNISSDSLHNPEFASRVEKTIKKYKIPENYLQLEISESLASHEAKRLKEVMDILIPLGVSFAMDNFGTVVSSKENDLKLPFNEVKIDRSCLVDIEQNQRSLISLTYLVDRAKDLGYVVTAQGVENQSQVDLINSIKNIDEYQGYFFSKPLSINNYIEFLNFKN